MHIALKGQITTGNSKEPADAQPTHMENPKWPNPDAFPKSGSAQKSNHNASKVDLVGL
jgi:hypothetical protein